MSFSDHHAPRKDSLDKRHLIDGVQFNFTIIEFVTMKTTVFLPDSLLTSGAENKPYTLTSSPFLTDAFVFRNWQLYMHSSSGKALSLYDSTVTQMVLVPSLSSFSSGSFMAFPVKKICLSLELNDLV